MEQLIDHLGKERGSISGAPFTFLLLAVLMVGAAYLAARWRYSLVIDQLRQTNETLKERLNLRV
jgi:hypothetical protein